MELTSEAVLAAYPTAKRVDQIVDEINQSCPAHDIDTPQRLAMFVAQCLHESGGFKFMEEIWGPTKWQVKYEGNLKLGNVNPGDGKRFKGRGAIQLTGAKNYQAFSNWIGDPTIMDDPTQVSQPKYAVLSAIYYWVTNNLNRFADNDDIQGCTRAVNGAAMLGLAERTKYYQSLLSTLSDP